MLLRSVSNSSGAVHSASPFSYWVRAMDATFLGQQLTGGDAFCFVRPAARGGGGVGIGEFSGGGVL